MIKKQSAVYKDNVKNTDCIDSLTRTMNNKHMQLVYVNLLLLFKVQKKSESKKSLIHFFTFALFYKWGKKNHLEMLLKAVSKFGKKNIEKKKSEFLSKGRPSFLHFKSLGNTQSIQNLYIQSKNILLRNNQFTATRSQKNQHFHKMFS